MGMWVLYNHPVYLKISAKKVKPCKTVLCFLQVHMHINTDMFKCLQGCAPNRQRWGGMGLEGQVSMQMGSLTFGALIFFNFFLQRARLEVLLIYLNAAPTKPSRRR